MLLVSNAFERSKELKQHFSSVSVSLFYDQASQHGAETLLNLENEES
jgi:hypothetical protein